MNYNINSSGIYDINSYNLISNNATILSSLNVGGAIIGPNTISSITTIFNNLNSLSSQSFFLTNYTNLNSLNVSGITILNNTTSINSSLNVSGILNIYSNTIKNYLFNNTGSNHATYQKFNNIDKFGYSFIQNSTNGPGTAFSDVNPSHPVQTLFSFLLIDNLGFVSLLPTANCIP